MSKKEKLTYESALKELQEIVGQLQEEVIGLDELSEKVQRASMLIQFCKEKLRSTEKEIQGLLEE